MVNSETIGFSVSADGNSLVVGACRDDDGEVNSGSAYIFVRSGTTWSQQSKLSASDAGENDWFGWAVSLSGDSAVVGAHQNGDDGFHSGSAYVFVRNGTTWAEEAKLVAGDAGGVDGFGKAVSIFGDMIAVGALGNCDAGSGTGSAYVFARSGTSWTQLHKLLAPGAAAADFFGHSIGVSETFVATFAGTFFVTACFLAVVPSLINASIKPLDYLPTSSMAAT